MNEQKGGIKESSKPRLMLLVKCNRRHLREFCAGEGEGWVSCSLILACVAGVWRGREWEFLAPFSRA